MTRAIILARASDPKQVIKGDTIDDQIHVCRNFVESKGWKLVEIFTYVESGRKSDKEYYWKIHEYCKERKDTANKIDCLVVKNLSRFNRGGSAEYLILKRELGSIGVVIKDTLGTVGDKVNTLGNLGFEYDWSVTYPTEACEISQAEGNLQYVKNQLTQMIGSCIRYIQKGYWNGPAPFGLSNKRVETVKDGIRNILIENERENHYIRRIFEMRAKGTPDRDIVKAINLMGFKTRMMVKRDKKTKIKIGTRGGVELTIKKIQEYVMNPIYCGIIVAKWTHHQPVKAAIFNGLVEVDTFNAANKGKIYIVMKNDGSVVIERNVKWANINQPDKRMRNNPYYPFKEVLTCPTCHKELKASASKGGHGKKFPSYFCDRKHDRWHEKRDVVHKNMVEYLDKIKFSEEYANLFQESFLESWNEKRQVSMCDSEKAETYVAELVSKRKDILESIKASTSPLVRKALEEEFEDIDHQIDKAKEKRNEVEKTELDIKVVLRYARYLMEHPGDILADKENNDNRRYLFGLVFDTLPDYNEIVNGTAKLQPIFQLKRNENMSKEDLVQRVGVEPTQNSFTDCHLAVRSPLVYVSDYSK